MRDQLSKTEAKGASYTARQGKAKMVANALSIEERLKMKMSLGELIRDFEKMEIEVKVTGADTETLFEIAIQPELSKKIILCQEKVMNEGRESMTGEEINTKKDDKGITREYRRNDSRITLEVLQGERKGQRGGRHFKLSRYRLMRSLREDNVDLPYVRMKL
ncbi:hypothetical protein AgCh_010031 [Apium graveolens]